jgi:hypothetical protein
MFHNTTLVVILNTQESLIKIIGQKVRLPCSHEDAVGSCKVSTLPGIKAQFPETLVRILDIILIYPRSVSIVCWYKYTGSQTHSPATKLF